ncbi:MULTISPECIES: type II CRISPR RNA-guided endonuclease Cas9 [Lacticaseibacillus]|uniref:type II CRISPR RNA-guided endonuclease Cas9 n=1 Tax=Lacticaseibacillus TaxID=2759736 RepID=UPI00063DA820|nr:MULTISPECIES: type II CRISPR RNA-guided endonuclease Cas9 [Lacticaseibacillus]KLI75956.1 CRISPR-associated protein [Lacticaseibacillus casei]
MTKLNQPYGIGLDIGSSSIGFAVVDANSHLLRLKGETAIGARLFREGESAAGRRASRTTRRRLSHNRWRLRFLQDFFDPHISSIDPDFFLRQKYSEISPKDKERFKYEKRLFNDRTDAQFYKQYPTMYHLRLHLMNDASKADPREIFFAIHHILKSRGHFLTPGDAKNFNTDDVDLKHIFPALTEAYAQAYPDLTLSFEPSKAEKFKSILLDEDATSNDTQKALVKLLLSDDGDKEVLKQQKKVLTEFAKAVAGLKVKFNVALGIEVTDADVEKWHFGMAQLEDKWSDIEPSLTDQGMEIFEQIQDLYRARLLNGIVPAGKTLSQAKVDDYDQHCKDLKLFKEYLKQLNDHDLAKRIRLLYDRYIDGDDAKPFLRDDFVKALKKEVTAHPTELAESLLERMEQDNFMLKQRTKANGSIPVQMQQRELDKIIANQAEYYSWLAAENPVKEHRDSKPYQLDELLNFRIPYYVGPMITKKQQEKSGQNVFAWMVRKDPSGNITPYNFDEKVDREASANAFIQRMKTTDTYLIGEDVLPKQSLLYQKYEVLNELNNVRVNGESLSTDQKKRLIRELFERHSSVTLKQFVENLVAHGDVAKRPDVRGLADEKRFLSSLSTYHQLRGILHDAIDDRGKQSDIENIITWSTVFEDASIFKSKLGEISWLDSKTRTTLSNIRYRGWGQFSRKLLDGLKLGNGHTIIQELMLSSRNLMQILTDETLKKEMATLNQERLKPDSINEAIDAAYTSPSNKKAIRQVLKVVDDIKHAANDQAPSWLYIETADGGGHPGKRTLSRQKQIQAIYENTAKELIDSAVRGELKDKIADKTNFSDRLVLYFMQGGHDIYTGTALNIDQLSSYDIDHILPQSLIKDDSLDNRVLVHAKINREKNAEFASTLFAAKMASTWHRWRDAGLISGRKLKNLLMRPDEVDKYAKGFVARQLVETRQIIKLTEQIVAAQYPDTKIIAVKAGLSHQLRQELDFPKNRDVNHYHHAFDAFLAARIGTYLLKRYPNLAPFFTYGEFTKTNLKKLQSFNFIGALTHTDGKITSKDTGEVLWDNQRDIEELDQIYNFKRMLITHEVYFETAGLFKQTVYAAKDSKERGGSRQLIPKKKGYSTGIYGGYTQETGSYNALVRLTKAGKVVYRVFKISTQNAAEIAAARSLSAEEGNERLCQILEQSLLKTNKDKKNTVDLFDVVIPRLGKEALFHNSKYGLFLVNSDTYYHNYQELWLSRENQKILKKLFSTKYDQSEMDRDALHLFETIAKQVEQFFKLYDINQFRTKISSAFDAFEKLPVEGEEGKVETLKQLLIGLHANPVRSDLKNLGIKTPFGFLQAGKGIHLDDDTEIIQQSPAGLFKRRVRLADL